MKTFMKLSVLAILAVSSAAIAHAGTLQIGSFGQFDTNQPFSNTGTISTSSNGLAYGGGNVYDVSPYNGSNLVWHLPVGNSNWVSYAGAGPAGPTVVANGTYTFQTTFMDTNLSTGYLYVMADDTASVYLNNNLIAMAAPPMGPGNPYSHCSNVGIGCMTPTLVSLPTGDFLTGLNTLTFDVNQVNGSSFGLNFDGTVSTVPEPGTLLLLGTGLFGLAGALFLRNRGPMSQLG